MGQMDVHCQGDGGMIVQRTDPQSCRPDAGTPDGGMNPPATDGRTLFNSAGAEDACKYNVSFYATPVRKGDPITFTVKVLNRATGMPVTGANLRAEASLNTTHPAPSSKTMTTEQAAGVYVIGPIVFDAKGLWTVHFRLFADCSDVAPDSPRGHVAFYINVP